MNCGAARKRQFLAAMSGGGTVQPRMPSGVPAYAVGGVIGSHPSGYCPACGYSHQSLTGNEIAGVSPPDDMGESIWADACPGCGYAFGGEVEPANLDDSVNDPDEERRRYAFALMRGGI